MTKITRAGNRLNGRASWPARGKGGGVPLLAESASLRRVSLPWWKIALPCRVTLRRRLVCAVGRFTEVRGVAGLVARAGDQGPPVDQVGLNRVRAEPRRLLL